VKARLIVVILFFFLALTCSVGAAEAKFEFFSDRYFAKCVKILRFGTINEYYIPTKNDAIVALGLFGEERAIPVLVEHLENEENDQLRLQIVRSLGWIKSPKSVPALEKALKDKYVHVREIAKAALKEITGKDYTKELGEQS
jgi:HEAT repeats